MTPPPTDTSVSHPACSPAAAEAPADGTRLQRLCRRAVLGYLGSLSHGSIRLVLPAGGTVTVGTPGRGPSAELAVRRPQFFTRVALAGDVGFGEAYTAGDWDSPDLPRLLRLLAGLGEEQSTRNAFRAAAPARLAHRLGHRLRPNSLGGSRRNIRAHYDLSNAFFQTFLDPSLQYSSAVYQNPAQDLAAAQQHKLRLLLAKADLRPEHHLLEIGTGWGALALEAAGTIGCRVTTITLSEEQARLARCRVAEAGLQDRVSVEVRDYRRQTGTFDRILSVEMLEAVGHAHLGTFFAVCDRLLKPGGRMVLQVITIPDQRYDAYRKGCDWIQKHIFPGGMVPSLTALCRAMTDRSRFVVEQLENIGPHYARTLRDWRIAFQSRRDAVTALGFDETFQRTWLYYLAYCEAGFAERLLNNLHLVLVRPGCRRESDRPPCGPGSESAHG